jgi:hypothetical protein
MHSSIHRIAIIYLVTFFAMYSISSCQRVDDTDPVGSQDWLTGDTRQKLVTITDHLRGFDMAMPAMLQKMFHIST